jgi:hypothetical protein
MLSAKDKVQLDYVQRYLDFKIGEVWDEIDLNLQKSFIRPTSPDQACIETSKLATKEKALKTSQKQKMHLEEHVQNIESAEHDFMTNMAKRMDRRQWAEGHPLFFSRV